MLRKFAIAAATAIAVAGAGLGADSASGHGFWPHGGGFGGGFGHGGGFGGGFGHGFGGGFGHGFGHGFGGGFGHDFGGGGPMMHFGPYGFSRYGGFGRSSFYRRGGFYHGGGFGYYGGRPYGFGHSYGWGHHSIAGYGHPAIASGATWGRDHSWNGGRGSDHGWNGGRGEDRGWDRGRGWDRWRDRHRRWGGWDRGDFWPYAYGDMFDWGDGDDFWSYGYDDLFAGVLLPYAMLAPGGGYGGAAPARFAPPPLPPQASVPSPAPAPAPVTAPSAGPSCPSAQSLGGAAIDPIAKAVQPTGDQSAKLDALKNAETDAEKTLVASCGGQAPATALGRLDAVQARLQAMIQAANTVAGPLGDFYASLTDEQKAAFNALSQGQSGPSVAPLCGPNNAVPLIAVDQITAAAQPDARQQALLAKLSEASGKADDAILASCPKLAPLTPTGRLAAVKARLQAMLDGVNLIRPPLLDFYASLSDAQKAKFDALTQPPAASEENAKAQP